MIRERAAMRYLGFYDREKFHKILLKHGIPCSFNKCGHKQWDLRDLRHLLRIIGLPPSIDDFE